jgi:hypothetical protein
VAYFFSGIINSVTNCEQGCHSLLSHYIYIYIYIYIYGDLKVSLHKITVKNHAKVF